MSYVCNMMNYERPRLFSAALSSASEVESCGFSNDHCTCHHWSLTVKVNMTSFRENHHRRSVYGEGWCSARPAWVTLNTLTVLVGQNRQPGHTCNACSLHWLSQLILNIELDELDAKWISCLPYRHHQVWLAAASGSVCRSSIHLIVSDISPSQQASGFSAK